MNTPGGSLTPKILVAPLDWGLGHATRCIPVIKELLAQNCTVILAAEGRVKLLLEKEFPNLPNLQLLGYRVKYSKKKWSLMFSIMAQLPKMLRAINLERKWLKQLIANNEVDAVISDNRYGLYHNAIRSVFITHQLHIKSFSSISEKILQKLNYSYIDQFSECWVPDVDDKNNLSGDLGHPLVKPGATTHYIGALSRFQKDNDSEEKHLLILLSGPEPQRSILEKLLIGQLEKYKKPVVLVRGLPGSHEKLDLDASITVYNHLPSESLKEKILQASFVVARCGYSSIMDVAALQKKSVLIPTPGQTEQEYLAKHLMNKNFAFCVEQSKFKLAHSLALATSFDYKLKSFSDKEKLSITIQNFLMRVKEDMLKK